MHNANSEAHSDAVCAAILPLNGQMFYKRTSALLESNGVTENIIGFLTRDTSKKEREKWAAKRKGREKINVTQN